MSAYEFKFKILPEKNIVVTQSSGALTLPSYLNEFKRISLQPTFKRNINYLHDLRCVDSIEGSLSDHEEFAKFAVSISSSKSTNVVFIINDHAIKIKQFIEGYVLMASRSNRHYWIYPESQIDQALDKVDLIAMPQFENAI
ncbi:hypothetical protein AAEU29_12035 [Pseudoalteromonas sp. SSM20]|uniref:hypothetical protein n=1 Tax=Pseudoalteromonas sp. SSM20 TaxID=3139394 RepID=UPI003BAA5A07